MHLFLSNTIIIIQYLRYSIAVLICFTFKVIIKRHYSFKGLMLPCIWREREVNELFIAKVQVTGNINPYPANVDNMVGSYQC